MLVLGRVMKKFLFGFCQVLLGEQWERNIPVYLGYLGMKPMLSRDDNKPLQESLFNQPV